MSRFTTYSGCATRCLTALVVGLVVLGPAAAASANSRMPGPRPLVKPRVAAAATVSCATPSVAMYRVGGLGELSRWGHDSPLDGVPSWTQQQISTNWTALTTFSGGGGVIFTIDSSGDLHWSMDDHYSGGPASWDPASGSVVGIGWDMFQAVISDGDGVIYAIDATGALRWYRYTGTAGTFTWAPGSGSVIGTGWGGLRVFAGGQGVIYAINSSGLMRWYRDTDPTGGSGSWAGNSGAVIGSGWSALTNAGSVGGGIIFAQAASGTMAWYRDTDPLGGTASWDAESGRSEGTGWNGSQIVADVSGCTAS